jgi:hypothetical protein
VLQVLGNGLWADEELVRDFCRGKAFREQRSDFDFSWAQVVKHTLRLKGLLAPRCEPLDLGDYRVDVAKVPGMILPLQFDVLYARNAAGEKSPVLDADGAVGCAMENQGRHAKCGQARRTSIFAFIRMRFMISLGLDARRMCMANHCLNRSFSAIEGAHTSTPTGPPQSRLNASPQSLCSSGVPAQGLSGAQAPLAKPPYTIKADTRRGYVAAKRALMEAPSETPIKTARRDPAASMTARMSSIRSSRQGVPTARSESPVPRLSK